MPILTYPTCIWHPIGITLRSLASETLGYCPPPSNGQHLSCDDCLDIRTVLCCVVYVHNGHAQHSTEIGWEERL